MIRQHHGAGSDPVRLRLSYQGGCLADNPQVGVYLATGGFGYVRLGAATFAQTIMAIKAPTSCDATERVDSFRVAHDLVESEYRSPSCRQRVESSRARYVPSSSRAESCDAGIAVKEKRKIR